MTVQTEYYIYIIYNRIINKCYIGSTNKKQLHNRLFEHLYYKLISFFQNAPECYTIELLKTCYDKKISLAYEQLFINKYRLFKVCINKNNPFNVIMTIKKRYHYFKLIKQPTTQRRQYKKRTFNLIDPTPQYYPLLNHPH